MTTTFSPKKLTVTLLALLGLAAPAFGFPTNGIVASYLFNGNANDSSGNGHHGTLIGATLTTDRLGNPNSAYLFSSNTQSIILPNDLLTNNQGSICFWFRNDQTITGVTGSGSYHPFNSFEDPDDRALNLGLGDVTYIIDGEILGAGLGHGFGGSSPRSGVAASTIGPIQPGWHHVALTSSSTGHVYYLDGEKFIPTIFNGGVTFTNNLWPQNAVATRIAGSGSSDEIDKPYALDEFLIYDRALSEFEIGSIAQPPVLNIRFSQVEVCWNSFPNLQYQVQYRSDLTTNLWVNFGAPITATNSSTCVVDDIVSGQPQRFYRVFQEQ